MKWRCILVMKIDSLARRRSTDADINFVAVMFIELDFTLHVAGWILRIDSRAMQRSRLTCYEYALKFWWLPCDCFRHMRTNNLRLRFRIYTIKVIKHSCRLLRDDIPMHEITTILKLHRQMSRLRFNFHLYVTLCLIAKRCRFWVGNRANTRGNYIPRWMHGRQLNRILAYVPWKLHRSRCKSETRC